MPMNDRPRTLRLWKSRPKNAKIALKRVAQLLNREAAWTKGSWAKDCNLETVNTLDPLACKVCLEGAVYRACGRYYVSDDAVSSPLLPELDDRLVARVFKRLDKKIVKLFGHHNASGGTTLYAFNDANGREFAEIKAVVNAAVGGTRVRKN